MSDHKYTTGAYLVILFNAYGNRIDTLNCMNFMDSKEEGSTAVKAGRWANHR